MMQTFSKSIQVYIGKDFFFLEVSDHIIQYICILCIFICINVYISYII